MLKTNYSCCVSLTEFNCWPAEENIEEESKSALCLHREAAVYRRF